MSSLTPRQRILNIDIEDEMKTAYIDYSMSVIVSRALPESRDGLKPSQRRILVAMKRRQRRGPGSGTHLITSQRPTSNPNAPWLLGVGCREFPCDQYSTDLPAQNARRSSGRTAFNRDIDSRSGAMRNW